MRIQKNKILLWSIVITLCLTLTQGLLIAKKEKMDPDSKEFYKYGRYLLTKTERKIFNNLPTTDLRKKFIQYFWDIRDPNPYTEENEFKWEIEKRMLYVEKYLKEGPIPGWKTDRGRLYIMLGPPYQQAQQFFNKGSMIYWYYEDSDIYTEFHDESGQGVYRMVLHRTSLKLLDILEHRKHYVSTKETSRFSTALLKYDVKYDEAAKELVFDISTGKVNFDRSKNDDKKMVAEFKVDVMIYGGKEIFSKFSEIKKVEAPEEDLLGKNATVQLRVPIKLPSGKSTLDIIVSDFLGDATKRELIIVKNK